jgi:opacity protein-like surface antigen
MKKSIVLAALAVALSGSGAYAADAYSRGGSTKDVDDGPVVVSTKSGFYVSGNLGLVVDGDRRVTQRTRRENGDLEDGDDPDGDGPLLAPEDTVQVPDDISSLTNSSSADLDDMKVFGGEVSYLWQIPGRPAGLELGLAGTFYRDSKTVHAWTGMANYSLKNGEEVDPTPTGFDSEGFTKVERKYDIDLVLKAHYFLRDRWSVYAGGGISYARADISGGSRNSLAAYDNEFKNSESAFGYVVVLGSQYWITENIIAGLEYNYKEHSFDLGGSTTRTGDAADSARADYTVAGDRGSADDRLHIVKGKVGLRF